MYSVVNGVLGCIWCIGVYMVRYSVVIGVLGWIWYDIQWSMVCRWYYISTNTNKVLDYTGLVGLFREIGFSSVSRITLSASWILIHEERPHRPQARLHTVMQAPLRPISIQLRPSPSQWHHCVRRPKSQWPSFEDWNCWHICSFSHRSRLVEDVLLRHSEDGCFFSLWFTMHARFPLDNATS